MRKTFCIVFSALMILGGVLCVLETSNIMETSTFLRGVSFAGWWEFLIIVPCAIILFLRRGMLSCIIGLAIAVLFILAACGRFEFAVAWKMLVPLVVILVGVRIIYYALGMREEPENDADQTSMCARFGCKSRSLDDAELSVANISAIFGGVTCNLQNAKIQNGSKINLNCLFGGTDILLDREVNLKINATCIFGGIEDKREDVSFKPDAPTLEINGICIFGGADIQ